MSSITVLEAAKLAEIDVNNKKNDEKPEERNSTLAFIQRMM